MKRRNRFQPTWAITPLGYTAFVWDSVLGEVLVEADDIFDDPVTALRSAKAMQRDLC